MNKTLKVLLVAAISTTMLSATGCAVSVRGKRRPLVTAHRLDGELTLSVDQDNSKWKSSSGNEQTRDSRIMSEELFVKTAGDVFDPMLMSYLAGVGMGLHQQEFDSEMESGSSSGDTRSYQLNMNFLPLKPYPFSIHMSKRDSILPRPFQSPLRVETSTEGISGRLRVPEWPMTYSWSTTESEQDSDVDSSENAFKRITERFSYQVTHDFSERSNMTFRSDLDSISQQGRGPDREIDTARHRLLHDYTFGSSDQYKLDTSASYIERSGDFDSETFNWSENLLWRHSPTFSTVYNAMFSRNEFFSVQTDTIGGMAGFRHRLYNNLVTNFNLLGNRSKFGSTGESTLYGGNLRFNYIRSNPWGRIKSEYSAKMTTQESTSDTGTDVVIGESHTFTDPFSITLEKRDVIIDTIVVSNTTGTEIYTEGDDYTISVIGDRTELHLTPLGTAIPNITDGQDILVDYLVRVEASREVDSLYQTFRIEQEFNNGFSVFYAHRARSFDVESTPASRNADQWFKSDTFGAEYKNKNIFLSAEHSELRSTQNSSESNRLTAGILYPLSSRTTTHGRVSQTWIESTGGNARQTSLFKADAGIKTRLSKYLRLTGDAEMRKEDSSDIGRTEGLRLGTALEYNRRALSARLGWDTYFLERPNTETTTSTFYLKIIRRF